MSASPDGLAAAAGALAELLERENGLLAALDLGGAAQLLAAKQQATSAFLKAQVAATAVAPTPAACAALRTLAPRLKALAGDNRRLLERGLAAQGRVIAVIARAARTQPAAHPRYAASGVLTGPRTPSPLAISARV
jgi:hypothetical protein